MNVKFVCVHAFKHECVGGKSTDDCNVPNFRAFYSI